MVGVHAHDGLVIIGSVLVYQGDAIALFVKITGGTSPDIKQRRRGYGGSIPRVVVGIGVVGDFQGYGYPGLTVFCSGITYGDMIFVTKRITGDALPTCVDFQQGQVGTQLGVPMGSGRFFPSLQMLVDAALFFLKVRHSRNSCQSNTQCANQQADHDSFHGVHLQSIKLIFDYPI